MEDYKEIQLTEDLYSYLMRLLPKEALDEFARGRSCLFIPPKRKVIKLADLPDGTKVEIKGVMQYWIRGGELFSYKYVDESYGGKQKPREKLTLCQGDWLPWFGGECPWPDGVMVEVIIRNGEKGQGRALGFYWEINKADHDIIAHRCIGLADGYELGV